MMDKVLITGGNGFIGSHIVREFINHQVPVVCLVRNGSSLENLKGLPVELKVGDVGDKSSLNGLLDGISLVIHNAGRVGDWGGYDAFYQTNVTGARNIMEACAEAGIRNVIMTSTCSVYGEENYPGIKDENFGFHSHYRYFLDRLFPCGMNYYRDTKALAEKAAIELAGMFHIDLTILEPVWVYGEREFHTGFYEYMKTAKEMPFVPGSRKNKFHVIYAGDLARAYYQAYQKKLEGIHQILIGNEKAEKMDRIYSLFCKEAGIKKPALFPKWLFYPAGLLLEWVYTALKLKSPPLLTRGRVNMFYDNIEYSIVKAEKLLGFKTQFTLQEGIHKTVEWYKANRLI